MMRTSAATTSIDAFHAHRGTGQSSQQRARIKIDWQRLALNIRSHIPLVTASRKIGRHQDWLNQVARGEITEPKFMDGLNLLNLHLDLCGAEKHSGILIDA